MHSPLDNYCEKEKHQGVLLHLYGMNVPSSFFPVGVFYMADRKMGMQMMVRDEDASEGSMFL